MDREHYDVAFAAGSAAPEQREPNQGPARQVEVPLRLRRQALGQLGVAPRPRILLADLGDGLCAHHLHRGLAAEREGGAQRGVAGQERLERRPQRVTGQRLWHARRAGDDVGRAALAQAVEQPESALAVR